MYEFRFTCDDFLYVTANPPPPRPPKVQPAESTAFSSAPHHGEDTRYTTFPTPLYGLGLPAAACKGDSPLSSARLTSAPHCKRASLASKCNTPT